MNLSNARALRRSRELLKVTREELGVLLGVNYKSIEKFENGRVVLDQEKILKILKALELSQEEFKRIKKGKGLGSREPIQKKVCDNNDRRSYQKIITKEVKVLSSLRKICGLSQDKASSVCGYSRPSIGHIENGRIEIPLDRIRHIVSSYGFQFSFFEELMKEEFLRDEIIKTCYDKLLILPEQKLKLVQSMLENL